MQSTDQIGKAIVDAAFKVRQDLGPGLLEKIYETCLSYELESRGHQVLRQKAIPVKYRNLTFDEGFRIDLLVDNCVIIEIKAVEKFNPIWQAQILSYMKMTEIKLGYLINFNTLLFKSGIQRFSL
ncbi:GxxExxY protein [Pelobacter sp. M08fum]|uniref:GxxExxY protein n=2 Tax=Pelovirga terrestris TaxID=2771352 RepID=A0A8J6QXW0_9BACT|nr:GxxExxY protein [Pelovirga terrestris]MBD1401151.1 GxxExxY protein [Pelovirga terrestris]